MARRKTGALTIEELIEDPTVLKSTKAQDVSLKDVIIEIIDLTGFGYDKLGEVVDLSGTTIGRIVRGDIPSIDEDNLLKIIKTFNLPFKSLIYSNALARVSDPEILGTLSPVQGAPMDLFGSASETVDEEHGEIRVLEYVRLNTKEYNEAEGIKDKIQLINRDTSFSINRLGQIMPVSRENVIYIRHLGLHMVSSKVNQKIIQDKAVVEIEVVPEDQIRSGDVVFAQLEAEWATNYIYRKQESSDGIIEQFRPANPSFPLRNITHVYTNNAKPLKDRRIIIGRAIRIVDYDLQS